ncbi:MAG: hypothetical protein BIFFINMI_04125 [Phycisphaerae bacterium]|nr:hypothetical protein [Phycisphaerae bacterium]
MMRAPEIRKGRVLGMSPAGLAAVGVSIAAVVALAWWGMSRLSTPSAFKDIPTADVTTGEFRVLVSADGSMRSDQTVDLKSQLEGRNMILKIVKEGTRIEKAGEFLVQLDSSELMTRRDNQKIQVKQSQASMELAQRELDIQLATNESDLNQANLKADFAATDYNKYVKGDWPQQEMQATNAITLAQEEFQRAKTQLDDSQKLMEKGYISKSDLDADKLAYKKFELDCELATKALEVLREYTHKKDLKQYEENLKEAKAELQRTRDRAEAREAKARADFQAKKEAYGLEDVKLKKIERQIATAVILSPGPGLVVYASTGERNRWNQDPIDVGYEARENETIIRMPDLTRMVADVNVPEAKVSLIKNDQPALLKVDARPETVLRGHVTSVGVLPTQQAWWRGGSVQEFQVVVTVEDPPGWLRPGMRCNVQVLVQQIDDALQVPIQAVFPRGEQHVCYVVNGHKLRCVPVWVGVDNDQMVHILGGLKTGQKVLLAEPPNALQIPVEKADFEMPEPVARPILNMGSRPGPDANRVPGATTQPDGELATTQPDESSLTPEEQRVVDMLRQRGRNDEADRLIKMTPQERQEEMARRRQAMEQRRKDRENNGDGGGGQRGSSPGMGG